MKTLKRSTQITALCVTALCVIMPVASADPDPAPPVDPVAVAAISPADQAAPPPPGPEGAVPPGNPSYLKTPSPADETAPPPPGPEGAVPPGNTSYLKTPDGWELRVSAVNETLLPVLPLTTALSSREYLVGGTFIGSIGGSGKTVLTGGVLEAGYRIGCGITADNVDLGSLVSVNPTQYGRTYYDYFSRPQRFSPGDAETWRCECDPGCEQDVQGDRGQDQYCRSQNKDRCLCRTILHPVLCHPN